MSNYALLCFVIQERTHIFYVTLNGLLQASLFLNFKIKTLLQELIYMLKLYSVSLNTHFVRDFLLNILNFSSLPNAEIELTDTREPDKFEFRRPNRDMSKEGML